MNKLNYGDLVFIVSMAGFSKYTGKVGKFDGYLFSKTSIAKIIFSNNHIAGISINRLIKVS